MTLTNTTPSTRLSGEDRRCWLERTTDHQRKVVAGYEYYNYTPVRCIGHIDHKNCLFITLERWVDYPHGRRDIQRVQLLIHDSGEVISQTRYPIEISSWGEPDQPSAPSTSSADTLPAQGHLANKRQGVELEPESEPVKSKRRRDKGVSVLEPAAPSA